MYVVLTQDVPKLGSKNALVNVTRGYFVNFLEPKGFAKMATPAMIERLKDAIIAEREASAQKATTQKEALDQLQNVVLIIESKASDKGTLFEAVSEAEVATALKAEKNVDVDPSDLEMKSIKKVGDHNVKVNLAEQTVTIKVTVKASEEA